MTKKYPIALIEWEDAFTAGRARTSDDLGELDGPCLKFSVGFVVKRGKRLVLAQTITPGYGTIEDTITVPRSLIHKYAELKADA